VPNQLGRAMDWILAHLPWYDPESVKQNETRTEAIRRRSIAARQAAEATIATKFSQADTAAMRRRASTR